jgi:hypothetical protein
VAGDPMVVRSRRTTVDLTLLAEAGAGPAVGFGTPQRAARSVALNLFTDVELMAQLDHVEVVAPLGYAWVGQVTGVDGSEVILAVADEVLTVSIKLPTRMYSVRRVDGAYVIAEINGQLVPGDDVVPPPRDAKAEAVTAAAADSGDIFDLLLYYTTGVKNAAGGIASINSLVTGSIAQVNAVYAASGIATRVRLVAALETPYVDSGDTRTDLIALRNSSDVRAARDRNGADIVSLLVTRDPASSGRAYVSVSRGTFSSDLAYNVDVYYNFVGFIYALAHEIGHNQGCLHEPGNNGGDDTFGAFSYSLGYTDFRNQFYDVMSYGLGCSRCTQLNMFSSPVNTYRGALVGTPSQDSTRTINNTRIAIANYRPAAGGGTLSAPTGLTASASGSTLRLAWAAPASGTPTAYIIEAGSASGLANLANVSTGNTATTFSASGVGPGSYYIRVKATNSAGTSGSSNEVLLIVGGGCTGAPGAPTGFTLTGNSGGTVSFSWNASVNATTYIIEAGSTPGSTNLANSNLGSSATSFTASNVGRGTYYVRLRAQNACGTSGVSNEVTLVVP